MCSMHSKHVLFRSFVLFVRKSRRITEEASGKLSDSGRSRRRVTSGQRRAASWQHGAGRRLAAS